jgi:hypothetical protein
VLKWLRFSKARAAIKTRVNALKRESLSAQKINRVSFVLLVLGSAVLRECNRSFFAIIERRKEIRAFEMVFQSRRHSLLGERERSQIFEKNVHFLIRNHIHNKR